MMSFDPSFSSTFSFLPCTHPICKPQFLDLQTMDCNHNHICHCSYFDADDILAKGNSVRERFMFFHSFSMPPFELGCVKDSSYTKGILVVNLASLSFGS